MEFQSHQRLSSSTISLAFASTHRICHFTASSRSRIGKHEQQEKSTEYFSGKWSPASASSLSALPSKSRHIASSTSSQTFLTVCWSNMAHSSLTTTITFYWRGSVTLLPLCWSTHNPTIDNTPAAAVVTIIMKNDQLRDFIVGLALCSTGWYYNYHNFWIISITFYHPSSDRHYSWAMDIKVSAGASVCETCFWQLRIRRN